MTVDDWPAVAEPGRALQMPGTDAFLVPDTRGEDRGTPAGDQGLRVAPDVPDASDASLDEVLLAGLRDGAWLDRQDFPPLRYAVPGLLPEGFTLLIGPPKAGKSWLILGTLLAVAGGGLVLGAIPAGPPRRVLYLALEDGDRRMQDRCRRLLDRDPIPDRFHYLTTVPAGRVLPTIEAFLRRYDDTALVVIDTLGKVMPPARPGESAYQRDYRIGGALKRIADERPGLNLTVLHHDRKAGSDDFVDGVSGTHGLAGSADTIVVLCRARHSTDGLLKVTGRDVQEGEYALVMADGLWQLDGANLGAAAGRARQRQDSAGLGDVSTAVLTFAAGFGPAGFEAKDAVAKFGENVYQYLKRHVDANPPRLMKLSRGRYATPPSEASGASGAFDWPPCRVCRFPVDPGAGGAGDLHPTCEETP
jgi:hypothetical protein